MVLKLGLILLVGPLSALLVDYFIEMSAVNQCIIAGGYFDYVKLACDMEQKQPFVPYLQRNPNWVNISFMLSLVGLVMCFFGLYKGRR